MPTAVRSVVRIQDQDDGPGTLGAGDDTKFLQWNDGSGAFVMASGISSLTGLSDTPANYSGAGLDILRVNSGATAVEFVSETSDFLTQYALLAGRAGGQTLVGGNAANDDITIRGTSHGTKTTSYVILQDTGGNVGIGTTGPGHPLEVVNAALGVANIQSSNANYSGLRIESTATGGRHYQLASSANGWSLATPGSLVFHDVTADAARMEIQSDGDVIVRTGNVGIGTTAPQKTLHVVGTILVDGDGGGYAGTIGFTDISDLTANSTGVGTVKMKGATSRDSDGFIKVYIGTTAYYVPVWSAITG